MVAYLHETKTHRTSTRNRLTFAETKPQAKTEGKG